MMQKYLSHYGVSFREFGTHSARLCILLTLSICVVVFAAAPLRAQTLITDLAEFSTDDQIDWGTLGPNYTLLWPPFTIESQGMNTSATLNNSLDFIRRDQGPVGGEPTWNGDFPFGDQLLFNNGYGPAQIVFSTDVYAVGFLIQNNYLGTFDSTIQAYGVSDNYLGSVTDSGISDWWYTDSSAPFIGLESSEPIRSIIISTGPSSSGGGENDFAIDTIYLDMTPIPEPSYCELAVLIGLILCCSNPRRPRIVSRADCLQT